jgi:hypothetical protein
MSRHRWLAFPAAAAAIQLAIAAFQLSVAAVQPSVAAIHFPVARVPLFAAPLIIVKTGVVASC